MKLPLPPVKYCPQEFAHSSMSLPCQNLLPDSASPLVTNGGFIAFGKPVKRFRDARIESESASGTSFESSKAQLTSCGLSVKIGSSAFGDAGCSYGVAFRIG